MNENENLVPKRRFKEFTNTGTWEERKLKDIAQFNLKTVLPDEFEYVDLESVVGTEMISHRTESKDQAPSRAQRLAQKGDVFYQTVRPYQMNNYLYDLPYDNYVFSTGYAQMRPNIDSYFLLNSVQNKQFVQHVLDRSTGTSYPAINSSDLSNIEIHVPSKLSEQQKIGAFFQSIDDTITLHQRKLEKSKALKSAYLSEMFPAEGERKPKRRFAGFTDDWEQRKLMETNTSFTDGNYGESYPSGNDMSDSRNGVPFLRGSNLKNGKLDNSGANYITLEKHKELTSGHLVYDDIVIAVRGSLGALGYVDIDNVDWNINSQLAIIRTDKSELNGAFVIQFLSSNKGQKELLSRQTGTALKQLPIKQLQDVPVPKPELAEQNKISEFFRQLDDTIALHQHKLEKLKNIKQAYLNELFV